MLISNHLANHHPPQKKKKNTTLHLGFSISVDGISIFPGAQTQTWSSLIAQLVKNPPAMRETWVQFLGLEDPLEKEMATHSSILAWKIPWTEEPGGLQSMGSQRVGHNW